MFAKLYGTDNDQILVKLDEGESGPEVRFYFQPEGMGVCSVATGFADTDAGWDKAEEAFKNMTEETARKLVAPQLAMISDMCME